MAAPHGNEPVIALIKSTFRHEERTKARLADFIRRAERLSMGEQCASFEAAFSAYHDRRFTALFNSGSSANLALIQALLNLGRLRRGDEVAFSAVTWSTNVMPLLQLGLVPIPVDVERDNLNVSSRTLAAALRDHPRIRAVFVSNILGFCADLDEVAALCAERRLPLLEDNCESFGSVYRRRKLGNYGLASTCSMYVGHHLSTIEGGVACTDDPELHAMLVMVRAHGWDRGLASGEQHALRKRFGVTPFYDLYTFYDLAYNLRPTEITGFLGLLQLEAAPDIVAIRELNFRRFHAAAARNPDLLAVDAGHMEVVSNFAYPVICSGPNEFEAYRRKFADAAVEVRPIVAGNIATQPFFRKYSGRSWNLPEAEFVHRHGLYFPNNPDLTEAELDRLVGLLKGFDA